MQASQLLKEWNSCNDADTFFDQLRLARLNDVYPIGQSTGTVTVAGQSWDLWVGMNGAMQVYSFIAPEVRNEFSADAKEFYNYLEQNQGFPVSSQNLIGECDFAYQPSKKPRFLSLGRVGYTVSNELIST